MLLTERNIINKHILAFLGKYELPDIDYAVLDKFKTYLFEKNLASNSIKIHFVAVKKIFEYAQRPNLIKSSPLMSKVAREDNARGYFTREELELLNKTAKEFIGNIVITEEIPLLISFMVFTLFIED